MCGYCEKDPYYYLLRKGKCTPSTQVKILSYWKTYPKKSPKKKRLPPIMVVCDNNLSGESSMEYTCPISYCPYCGDMLSEESYVSENDANTCAFCGNNPKQIFTWEPSNSKADIYLAADNSDGNRDLMAFEGDWGRILAVKINYCPYCGEKIRKHENPTAREGEPS